MIKMFIYVVTNLINGKQYVGLTTTPLKKRWREHTYRTSCCSALHKAIRKYGVDNFSIQQIDVADSLIELKQKEVYWIAELNTLSPNGYNLTIGGEHPRWSEESRQKLSSTEKGHPVSEETRRKISIANKGQKPSEKARLASSKSVCCVETGTIYKSITDAAKAVNGSMKAISYCLHGGCHTSGGYHWRWTNAE